MTRDDSHFFGDDCPGGHYANVRVHAPAWHAVGSVCWWTCSCHATGATQPDEAAMRRDYTRHLNLLGERT